MANDQAVRDMYSELFDAIVEIDIKLDSLDDSDSAGKRKIANDLVEASKTMWEPLVTKIIEQLHNLDSEPDNLTGVFRGLKSALDKEFKEQTEAVIASKVENAPKTEPLVSEEEAKVLQEQRSELYKNCKNVIELASTMYGIELEKPKIRRGSKGKRGPRQVTLMSWAIDGNELEDAKYKDVAIAAGFEGSAELTKFLKEKEVDTKTVTEIEVTLPDDRVLTGWIPAEEEEDGEDDD